MKDLFKELLTTIRALLTAPLVTVLCAAGILLLFSSFIEYHGGKNIALATLPDAWRFVAGIMFVAASIILYLLALPQKRLLRQSDLLKGVTIQARSGFVCVKVGDIANLSGLAGNCAIILPANTSFVDDCITDRKSALGAFFLTHFPDRIPEARKTMQDVLDQSNHRRGDDGAYPAGTTIILPSPFDRPCPLLITASTIRKPHVGILANPTTVCDCVRNIFAVTADRKIDTLYMPILGSGHGGLEKHEALLFLLLSIRHYAKYHHHLKRVEVVVWEGYLATLQEAHKLQYLSFLGG